PERPPLAARLRGALEETLEWAKGNTEARVTLVEDGKRVVGPTMMTRAEMEAHQAEREGATGGSSRLSYDASTDALHIVLRDARIAASDEVEPGIILSYDADGNPVAVQVRSASKRIRQPKQQAA